MAPCDRDQQGWPDTCGCPVQANNLVPLQPTFLVLFDLGQNWQTFFRMCAQVADNVAVKFFHVWKHEFTGTIFPVIPMTS